MKIALVITEGLRQIAFTPEKPDEAALLNMLPSEGWEMEVKRGQFFISRAGHARIGTDTSEISSVFLILTPKMAAAPDRSD